MNILICIMLIGLAAYCNAVMDILSHHYSNSIFYNRDRNIWDPKESWKNKYNYNIPEYGRKMWNIFGLKIVKHVAFTDAWHFFKSGMIILLITTIAIHSYTSILWTFIEIIGYGIIWNMTFRLFYTIILRR